MSKTEKNPEVNLDEQLSKFSTKSDKIRYLNSIGYKRSQIASKLDIRYQFVRNVLIVPLKKNS